MAEMLIGPLVSLLKEKVSSYLVDQYKVMQGMEEQRDILARRLPAILDVIEDAEKGASRPGVAAWLEALKNVSYEAIDVFDEFKMSKKLSKVVQAMDVLVKEMNDFGFTQRQQVTPSMQWRQTDSTMVDSDKDIASRSRN
ncbi:hypothetical protein E2562_012002 [Oryza meyeriana var. granulata]|uniref:Disease resistance N-terminal domain-containing protein n=1 Tax=Oryza meyeriana var. granulata TaxID=110450 RepID=A0A6G1F709_9ORYZ|nr:hypothetical protein E2562_012002 [Oryza meyeriana var. granulata]